MSTGLKSIAKRCGSLICGCLSVPIGFVLCCLLIWDMLVSKPRREQKAAMDLTQVKAIPFAGTGSRRRSLTPTQAKMTRRKIQSYSQSQSVLFKLPAELREIIWQACLCGNTFGIERPRHSGPKPGVFSKRPEKTRHYVKDRACSTPLTILSERTIREPGVKGLLSLLLSCQRAYTEGLSMLYTHNKFVIHHPSSTHGSIWRTGRFNFLTLLETSFLIYDIPHRMTTADYTIAIDWKENWATIATIPHLRHLVVLIDNESYPGTWSRIWYAVYESLILVEPRKITRPKDWLLILTWEQSEHHAIVNDQDPFEIAYHPRYRPRRL